MPSSQLAQAELNLQSLTSPYAIAEAEKELADAQEALYRCYATPASHNSRDIAPAIATIDAVKAELIMAEGKE